MFEKIFYTSVLVSDQDRALDFYTNVLGLEKRVENPTPDGPRFITVGVEGDDFQLVLWPGTPGQAEPAMGRPPASITIETDDVRKTFEEYPGIGVLLPAVGYGDAQMQDLRATIDAADCDLVIIATPIDLRRAIRMSKPALRVTYELQEIGKPDLDDVLARF